MKNKHIQVILVILILGLGIALRVFLLGKVPPSPDWDEAALGYNAYSILLTGKDEYGKTFPVVLESFDDYKPALYAYLIIPFISIFDLTITSVRIPSIIFGCISLLILYFIVLELFPKGIENEKVKIGVRLLALISMLFLSIAPWHIQFSRVAFEAQVGLSFNLIFILLFLKSLKKFNYLFICAIFAGLTIYVYQSEKVYMPMLLLLLISCFWKEFIKIPKKYIVSSFVIGILVSMPMILYIFQNPNALARAKGVSVFSDTTKLLSNNTEKLERDRKNGNQIGVILDNRRFEYLKAFASGYLSHFEPNWLFIRGDELRHQPPYMGHLYLFEIPLILVGLYVLLFSKVERRIKIFILGYVLISPIPAAVTYDVPHGVRTLNMLPAPQILSAIGFLYLFTTLRKAWLLIKVPVYLITILIIMLNITYYLNQYFVQMNLYYSKAWQYGWAEAVNEAQKAQDKFDKVVVSNVAPLDQSYIFFLFYSKYDPDKYLLEGGTKSGRFSAEHTAFGKYVFRPIDWNVDKMAKNTLFIGRTEDLPDNRGKVINYLNGDAAIVFSEKYE